MKTDIINYSKNIKLNRQNYLQIKLTEDNNSNLDIIAKELCGNADIIELSGENITSKSFIYIAQKVKQLCAEFDKILIIKDRLDITLLSDADGVFLTNDSIPQEIAQKILPTNTIIGSDKSLESDYCLIDNISEQQNTKPCFIKAKTLDNFVCYTLINE